MKQLVLLLFLSSPLWAQSYDFQQTDGYWQVLKDHQSVELDTWIKQSGAEVERCVHDDCSLLRWDSRVGLLDKSGRLVVPPRYQKLGMTTYVGEVGWVHSTQFFHGVTGFQADNQKWGLLDHKGDVVQQPIFDEILYDGYFFSGNINPIPGMANCRQKAQERGHKILSFALQGGTAVGYFFEGGKYCAR